MQEQPGTIDYLESVGRALTYVEQRLDSPVDLESIAVSAGFSKYYFGRVFQAMVGETVFDYVRKRRLSEIARSLIESDTPVVELALQWGYESQQSMTKAFRKRYGISPGRYRREGVHRFFYQRPPLTYRTLRALHADLDLKPTVVELPSRRLLGIFDTMPITASEPVEATRRRFQRIRRDSGFGSNENHGIYEVTLMRQEHLETFASGSPFDGFIGVLSDGECDLPPGCGVYDLPASRYLRFSYTGDRSIASLTSLYRYIFSTGLASRTEALADRDFFHVYPIPGAELSVYLPLRSDRVTHVEKRNH